MRKKKPVEMPRSERLAIAAAAECDERTIQKLLRGQPVVGRAAVKGRAELLKRGLLREAAE